MDLKEKKHISIRKETLNKTFEQRRYPKIEKLYNNLADLDILNKINIPFTIDELLEEINPIINYLNNENVNTENNIIQNSNFQINTNQITTAAIRLRKTLCNISNVQSLKANNSIYMFYKLLIENNVYFSNKKIMYECLWGLNNLSSIKNTDLIKFVKKHNIIYTLKKFLTSNLEDSQILSEAICCIGNLVLLSIKIFKTP